MYSLGTTDSKHTPKPMELPNYELSCEKYKEYFHLVWNIANISALNHVQHMIHVICVFRAFNMRVLRKTSKRG